MTRINSGVDPSELSGQHLIAEHREIKRIPNCIAKGKYNLNGIPEQFKLGAGHVKFFYNKLYYLKKRYIRIYNECKRRGYNVTNYQSCWDNVPPYLMNDYTPTQRDRELILARIEENNKKKNKAE